MSDTTTTPRGTQDDDPRRDADDMTTPPQDANADASDREEPGFSHGGTGDVPQPRGGSRPNEELQDE